MGRNCKKGVGSLFSRGGGLEQALSLERFSRYLAWAAGERARAIELYTLNTQLSESLYTPLQMLEVALRNRIHAVMTEARHEDWFHDSGVLLGKWQPDQIAKAIEEVREDRRELTPGRIVAALTFSFWTSMLGKEYETLWQTTLHRIGSRPDGKGLTRKHFSGPLAQIRILRNRIAHHEPIIAWDLPKHHGKIIELTGWLSPSAAE
jgi:Abi-like protein